MNDPLRNGRILVATAALLAETLMTAPQTRAQEAPPGSSQPPASAGPQIVTVRVPIFAHAIGGGWIPMPGVFAENHKPGPSADLMVGLSLEPFIHQSIDVFVDAMWSQQELQERAWTDPDHTRTVVVAGCVGLRWFLFNATGFGGPYILAGAGLVYETAEPSGHHAPPKPSWMTLGGVGWEIPLGSVVRVGARVTGSYLDEDGARLGWLAPSLTLGLEL